MTWLFAFMALAVVALVAFAHVGVRAASSLSSRDCGGRMDEDCAGCGALNGQRCFVSGPTESATETVCRPTKYPLFVPAKWYSDKPAELRLPDGTILLNELQPLHPEHYLDEWFDQQTGRRASRETIELINSEIEARNEEAKAIKRARKYGGVR